MLDACAMQCVVAEVKSKDIAGEYVEELHRDAVEIKAVESVGIDIPMENASPIAARALVRGGEGGWSGAFPCFFFVPFSCAFSASSGAWCGNSSYSIIGCSCA